MKQMKELALRIAALPKDDYDKEIYSLDVIAKEISNDTANGIELCEGFNLKGGDVLASEIIHSRAELAALKAETPGFRSMNVNTEKIDELTEFIAELETAMREKVHQASKMKSYKEREDRHAKALKTLEPLADELEALEAKIKDHIADIREVGNSVFDNTLNPDTFRLLHAMSKPGGALA